MKYARVCTVATNQLFTHLVHKVPVVESGDDLTARGVGQRHLYRVEQNPVHLIYVVLEQLLIVRPAEAVRQESSGDALLLRQQQTSRQSLQLNRDEAVVGFMLQEYTAVKATMAR